MVAGVEKDDAVVYSGAMPWHRTNCFEATNDDLKDWEKFGSRGNILWGTRKVPLVTTEYANKIMYNNINPPNNNWEIEDIQSNTDAYAIVRDDTDFVLGVVGSAYTPLNNRDAFSFFQDWLDENIVELNTAGTLFGGKKVWVLAKVTQDNIKDVVPNDNIERYVMLSNSFDGTTAVKIGFTNIRIVCANTMAQAHSSASSKLLRCVHSSQLKKNMNEIKEIMNVAHQEFEATIEQYKFLSTKGINKKDLEQYVKILLELDKKEDKDISTRSKNIMKKIFNLMDSPEQTMTGMSGTYWAAYNSFNHYLVHDYGRNAEHRLSNLWFGLNRSKNDKALNLALQMAS